MTLPIYLIKKFLNALFLCAGISYSIFFIFSLMGNLGEKFSFKTIFYLSALNSFQIFTYIPSHLFILSFCLFIINLKLKNELIIIKEYFELKNLFLVIFPILALFVVVEMKKDFFSTNIEKIKINLISYKKLGGTKILISSEGNKKNYTIFSGFDGSNEIVNQYLNFETENQKIFKGEISTNLNFHEDNLYSYKSIIFENNDFRYEELKKVLFENYNDYWSANNGVINKNKISTIISNYSIIQSIFFISFFYLCISIIFFSKKIVNRGLNVFKIILLILLLFLYFLLVPKVLLNNLHYLFQFISIMIFALIFFKIKKYE